MKIHDNRYIYGDDNDPIIKLIRTSFNSVSENPAFFQINPLAKNIKKVKEKVKVPRHIWDDKQWTPLILISNW